MSISKKRKDRPNRGMSAAKRGMSAAKVKLPPTLGVKSCIVEIELTQLYSLFFAL